MEDTYTLIFSRDQVIKTASSFLLQKMGRGYFIAVILLTGYFIFELYSGNRSWYIGTVGAIIFFAFVVPIALFVGHIRLGLRKLAEMPGGAATMTITDNGLIVRSAIASSEIPWKTITEVWPYPEYWLLLSGGHYLMTIPFAKMNESEKIRIHSAFKKANVKAVPNSGE